MTDAPKRIYINPSDAFNPQTTWATLPFAGNLTEYIRADTVAAMVAEARNAALEEAVEIAHGYHVKACKRMENDPAEYDRHAECASTAGSIAAAIRALKDAAQ